MTVGVGYRAEDTTFDRAFSVCIYLNMQKCNKIYARGMGLTHWFFSINSLLKNLVFEVFLFSVLSFC